MKIRTIAVIGAGVLGREIAYAAVSAGYTSIIEDISRARLDKALAWIAGCLEANSRDASLRNLSPASGIEEALAQADLIIETTADEMEMKLELVTLFDKFAKPGAIFASSGSLSITEMAEVTYRAERCIGMRFTDSLAQGSVLELVRGLETSQEAVDLCSAVGLCMRRKVIVVSESERSVDGHAEQKAARARN
jgi:3-hydroxybutyryl-CoA dehydrogenase